MSRTRAALTHESFDVSFDEAEVAAGDPGDGVRGVDVGGPDEAGGTVQLLPVAGHDGLGVFGVEWLALVDETDPAVELRGSGELAVAAGQQRCRAHRPHIAVLPLRPGSARHLGSR